jgi:hypothetical protein
MESSELVYPDYLRDWQNVHKGDIRNLSEAFNSETKAVFVEGDIHSSKTSLALSVSKIFEQRPEGIAKVYFTTPSVHESIGAKNVIDKTDITYSKLPKIAQVEKSEDKFLIIVDEVSVRKPDPAFINFWKIYFSLPNVSVLLLGQRGQNANNAWKKLLSSGIASYNLSN